MHIIASMFESRRRSEDAIERLLSARCPRDAITFLPEEELTELADRGSYDWRKDRWGLWRGLAMFETMSEADRYSLAEGMNRGRSVLLVAAPNDDDAERYSSVLIEAGAVDLDELEQSWRAKGWTRLRRPDGQRWTWASTISNTIVEGSPLLIR